MSFDEAASPLVPGLPPDLAKLVRALPESEDAVRRVRSPLVDDRLREQPESTGFRRRGRDLAPGPRGGRTKPEPPAGEPNGRRFR